ncbi:hypothetical protein KQY30_23100 [Streptomyces sp. GMY02]|uniref:hypothetical protein n=1 Tax=Streptomyces sp. GMY02 TaxID=1333528 RepID=UPI001C2C8BC6|nr:hypothetical protein [Streptomyces sp. GMY02]QXE36672.1 hypothetical protein KQY30_23100 [Streptomyces sp. GMY02]
MLKGSTENASSVEKTMLKLHKSCTDHIAKATKSNEHEINQVLHLEADLAAWLGVLESKPESQQLRSAHRDFGLAFYAAMSGLYRQAFSSLRSFLEVTVGATYLSSLEFKRRQWVSGILDISWSSITSKDDGLYSTPFLKEFCPEAIEEREEMHEKLRQAYRRCSEYIHGNVSTSQLLPTNISYREDIAKEWLSVATSTLTAVIHCLMVRYYKDLPETGKGAVEGSLEDHFSHLISARQLLGLPLEERTS